MMDLNTYGNLILHELRNIRDDMKEEIKKVCNEIKLLRCTNEKKIVLNFKERLNNSREKHFHSYNNNYIVPEQCSLETASVEMDLRCSETLSSSCNVSPVLNIDQFKDKSDLDYLENTLPDKSQFVTRCWNVDKIDQQLPDEELIDFYSSAKNETEMLAVNSAYPVIKDVKSLCKSNHHSPNTQSSVPTKQKPYIDDKRSFLQKLSLTNRSRIHTNKTPLKCHICKIIFLREVNLIQHSRSIHNGEKPFKCCICGQGFLRKSYLTTHTRIHTGEKPFKCAICDQSFTQKTHLTNHTRIHTGEKPYVCGICNKSFSLKSTLTCHIRSHTGEKPYKCNKCKMSFSHRSGLNQHTFNHVKKKPFKCSICDQSFSQKGHLTYHTRIHTGEKPYICRICDKSFSRKNILTCHIRSHTGEKPYKCNKCEMSFLRKSGLNQHSFSHFGEKPFKCGICDKSFLQKSSLDNHTQIHTGEKII